MRNGARQRRCLGSAASKHARRAALTLVSALFGFALLQALTAAVADFMVPSLRDPEYGRKLAYLQSQRRQAPDRPLLLFLGSSRTTYGVAAEAALGGQKAPLAYNFGIIGGGPIYELLCCRRLLAEGIRPNWLVVEIHPGFLHVVPCLMLAHRPPIERCDARDMFTLHGYVDHPWQDWLTWLRNRVATCHLLRAELLRQLAPKWATAPAAANLATLTPCGWTPRPGPPPEAAARKRYAQLGCEAFGLSYRDFQVSDRTNRALREILETCRRERIEARLLLMPESAEMRDEGARLAQGEVRRYLARLSEEYGARVIDATQWCASEDFADGQHLLPESGRRFTRRLGREVLSDWIASAQRTNELSPPARMAAGQGNSSRR